MSVANLGKTIRKLSLSGFFLSCLAVLLVGCQASKPSLSPEAQTLKTELRGETDKLVTQLIEPVSKQDWAAVEPILQTTYSNMEDKGKLVPKVIVVLDSNGITQGRFPPADIGHYDFSNYTPAQIVFKEKRKVQATLYFKGIKVFMVLAPLLQNDNVIGAVALIFPADAVEKQWHVSEKEFLSIDLNQ